MKKKTNKKGLLSFDNEKVKFFLYLFCFVFAASLLSALFLHQVESATGIWGRPLAQYGEGGAPAPVIVISTPQDFSCQVLSPTVIRWTFVDSNTNETGYRLFGPAGLIKDTGDIITKDLTYLDEANLLPNTLYSDRYVQVFSGTTVSKPSNTANCYTLANPPLPLIISSITKNSLVIMINPNDNNPPNTEYAIKELISNNYVQGDGTFGLTAFWQTYAGWGGANGIKVIGSPITRGKVKISLVSGQSYSFGVSAKNGSGVETAAASSVTTSTESVAPGPALPPAPVVSPVPSPVKPPVVAPILPPVVPPVVLPVAPPVMPLKTPVVVPRTPPTTFTQVQKFSQNTATPILLLIAVVNTIPTAIVLLPYLHLLFTEPLLSLFRKKRKKWGIVYDSLTKLPLDLTYVRLYSKADQKLVQTKVTDKEGRYIFIVKDPGKYYISVTRTKYNYPTKYLKKETQDSKYLDLYHGEEIEVKTEGGVITSNIPLDQVEKKFLTEKQAVRKYLIKSARLVISFAGMIFALLVVIIYPTIITLGSLILHLFLYFIFRRLVVPPKPKGWGIVYDQSNKGPIIHAVVRIFETKFNKLLETQVTDSKGRYAFLVGQNIYELLTEKEGYQKKEIKPVDLVKKEEIVNLDIGLGKI